VARTQLLDEHRSINAVAESFFATLKREVEEIDHLESHAQANAVLTDYIDRFYNVQRRHSTIGYRSPVEFVLMHCAVVQAA
jgi:putative transposase